MQTNKPTPPGFDFSGIPNNRAGRRFIAQMRTYANRAMIGTVLLRGNGPRKAAALADYGRARAYDQCLPIRHAKTFRVYLLKAEALKAKERREANARWIEMETLRSAAQAAAASARTHDQARREAEARARNLQADLDGTMVLHHDLQRINARNVGEIDALRRANDDLQWQAGIAGLERDTARHDARCAQLQLNAIPAWVLAATARANCCSAWARSKMRHFVRWVRATTGDLFVGGQS